MLLSYLDRVPSRNKLVISEKIGDNLILYNTSNQSFFELNSTGVDIWKEINGKKRLIDIESKMLLRYSVEPTIFRKDFLFYIRALVKLKLIELTHIVA